MSDAPPTMPRMFARALAGWPPVSAKPRAPSAAETVAKHRTAWTASLLRRGRRSPTVLSQDPRSAARMSWGWSTARVPSWPLQRCVRERASPAGRARAAIENALFRIALPHLDSLGLGSLLHHDVDFLSPADVWDVHRNLGTAIERDVR